MWSIIYKDFAFQKKAMIIFAGLYSLFFFSMFFIFEDESRNVSRMAFVVSPAVVVAMLMMSSFNSDKNKSELFLLSLPVSRDDAVIAKFVSAGLYALYGIVTTTIIGLLFTIFTQVPYGLIRPAEILSVAGITAFMTLVLPFYFRFGHQVLRTIVMIGLVLLLVANVLIFLLLQSAQTRGGGFNFVREVILFFEKMTPCERGGFFFVIGFAVLALSLPLSLRFYRRREF